MPIPLIFGAAAVLFAGGYAVDKTGEAAQDVAQSLGRLALVGGAVYFVLKKGKVL